MTNRHGVADGVLTSDDLPLALEATVGPRTLADRAFLALRDSIVTGQLEPGRRLRLEEVAERLGMSVMPVRDALRRLAAAGLVEFEPHRGATVATVSVDEMTEIFDLRLVIEIQAIERSSPHFTEADAVTARRSVDAYEAALLDGNLVLATEHHQQFHFALYRAHTYPWLVRTMMPLWEASGRYWNWLDVRSAWKPRERRKSHELLLQLCVEHRPEAAAAALTEHLSFGFGVLTRAMRDRLPSTPAALAD